MHVNSEAQNTANMQHLFLLQDRNASTPLTICKHRCETNAPWILNPTMAPSPHPVLLPFNADGRIFGHAEGTVAAPNQHLSSTSKATQADLIFDPHMIQSVPKSIIQRYPKRYIYIYRDVADPEIPTRT